jgi:GTPase SAR1 family protein
MDQTVSSINNSTKSSLCKEIVIEAKLINCGTVSFLSSFWVKIMAVKKIVFFGPASAGKSSLRKFFFEGMPADRILSEPETPTIGVTYNRYNYVYSYPVESGGHVPEKIPIELAIMDTSGQEIERFLTTQAREQVFKGADIVLFIFDVIDWNDDSGRKEYIMDFISFTNSARLELAPQSVFHVVGHKYDKHPAGKAAIEQTRFKIKNDLQDYVFKKTRTFIDFDVHIMSLHKDYRRDAFQELLDLTTGLLSVPF